MESSRAQDIEQFSPSSVKMKAEGSNSSSFANSSSTSLQENAEDSDDSLNPPPRAKRDIVPFQGDETLFPVAIHLPPHDTEIESYSALYNHLQQSTLLFEAFQSRFRIIPLEYCVANGATVLEFIKDVKTPKLQGHHFMSANKALTPFPRASKYFFKIIQHSGTRDLGKCMLVEMFCKSIVSKFSGMDAANAEGPIEKYGDECLMAIRNLKSTVDLDHSGVILYQEFHEALADAFDSQYYDPFGLVSDYVGELRENMRNWIDSPLRFNAPYTSVVNASMMGKSRLIKEIAMKIPTVYICLREQNDGYPMASPKVVVDVFKSLDYKSNISADSNEKNIVRSFLAFFLALLQNLRKWCESYEAKDDAQLGNLRKQLWLLLAEPKKSRDDTNDFWEKVGLDARNMYVERMQYGTNQLIEKMEDVWRVLSPFFSCTVNGVSESLLLIVWDEARILVNTGIDGRPADSSQVSIFRLLRRALLLMGRHGKPPVLRIFSLLVDTSSRVANFQPHDDNDSSRTHIEPGSGELMFPPIVLMPSVDAAARRMAITCCPSKVRLPSRLIRLGRIAWYLMVKTRTPIDILELAVSKLFRTARLELKELFASESRKDVKLKMLACLGPRLAIQMGPYETATKELVASHMMTLERIDMNHDHLEKRYLSEPILVEAAAEGTAMHGWARPLETLVSEMRHGTVDRGYRGEFITKVLLCMAVEDVQRGVRNPLGSQKGWQFTQAITVKQFLNSLFRNPRAREHTISTSTADQIFSPCGKHPFPPDDEPHNTKKLAKMPFDDSTSDDDEEVRIDNSDGVPTPDDSFVDVYINSEAEHLKIFGPETPTSVTLKGLLYGHVFFNHFVTTETRLRPSLLMKAWNRGAAIMTRIGTSGVDFVIPVVMSGKPRAKLGPFIGAWSDEEEKLADGIISYILIQTNSHATAYPADVREALAKCIPITKKHRPHDPLPNFAKHNPTNAYVSILMEFGVEKHDENQVQLMNVIDYVGLKEKGEMIAAEEETLKDKRKNPRQSENLKNLEQELQKLKTDYDIERFWLPIKEKQLSIVAYGLTQNTYKCLENRPNVARMLDQLAHPHLNSLRGLPPNSAAALRAGRHIMVHPDREYYVSPSSKD